jgi:methylenetetrahydrofolate reductase (NADPH)
MRIADLMLQGSPTFSFEFFPPKTEEGLNRLYATIEHLAELRPSFVSVTYGAGGGTRDRTVEVARRIKSEIGLEPMAHLTCRGHTQEQIDSVLEQLEATGVENVLALRGDPPRGMEENGRGAFPHADSLVAYIRGRQSFCIGGACYPEKHTEAPDMESDLARLVRKVEAGCDFLVTQLFFDNRHYFGFVRRCREMGVTVPIVPGIMPVTNVAQIERFTKMCGASVPDQLAAKLDRVRDDDQAVMAIGIEWSIRQCRELLALGAPGIHFYTLNRSLATRVVCASLHDVPIHVA